MWVGYGDRCNYGNAVLTAWSRLGRLFAAWYWRWRCGVDDLVEVGDGVGVLEVVVVREAVGDDGDGFKTELNFLIGWRYGERYLCCWWCEVDDLEVAGVEG